MPWCRNHTCEGYPGSWGYEQQVTKRDVYAGPSPPISFTSLAICAQDARTYAEWGVDYLKYDYCGSKSSAWLCMPAPRQFGRANRLLTLPCCSGEIDSVRPGVIRKDERCSECHRKAHPVFPVQLGLWSALAVGQGCKSCTAMLPMRGMCSVACFIHPLHLHIAGRQLMAYR